MRNARPRWERTIRRALLALAAAAALVPGAAIAQDAAGAPGAGAEGAVPAQEAPPETAIPETQPAPAEPGGTWRVHSPYKTLSRTTQLMNAIGLEVLQPYKVEAAGRGPRKLSDRPGSLVDRLYTRRMEDGLLRTIEIVAAANPSGGFDLYLLGRQLRGSIEEPNPEAAGVQAAIEALVARLAAQAPESDDAPLDKRRVAYESYQLSYVETDRAIALLKALDYTTVEFNESSGDTIYDRIFVPTVTDQPRLPVIVKMISASKTSLQESTADSGTYSFSSGGVLPDLGGVFLHRTTAAEPQNRLLIAYDPDDLKSLERIVNLMRDVVDIPARQLVLEALVIEIQGDATKDLGVTWGAEGTANAGRYLDTYSINVEEDPRLLPPPFTFMFNRASETLDFSLTLHALLATSKAKILSNPSVLVLDGRQAKIQIGNRIPVVETTVTTNSATESIQYFPVGIVLNLRPRVSEDGSEISMQVETIVSSARETLASALSSTRAPEVESRQVQTFVRVENDTPFIIGGLTTNEQIQTVRGVPFFSKIPGLGALFRRKVDESIRKEIIIVVTPHIVPEERKTFSYVIPQESEIFDSFGHELFYNAYRIRQQDVFDLDFLYESDAYRSLLGCAQEYAGSPGGPLEGDPGIQSLIDGNIPGEEILVRRMLWEIIRKTNYARFIDLERVIFFEEQPGAGGQEFALTFLSKKLAERTDGKNGLMLSFDARAQGTPDHPFGQPTAKVAFEPVTQDDFLRKLTGANLRSADGEPETWSLLLSDTYSGTAAPMDVLRGVIVLKALLNLNPNLPLTVKGFRTGRQIVFPTEAELRKSYGLIDPQAAQLFYQITSYYPAFEDEFKSRARLLARKMGGCEWWGEDAGGAGRN